MRTLWNDCELSTGFVQSRRSVRQYDLLLRCSSARLVLGFLVFAFTFLYSEDAPLGSKVRNHARVQGRSAVWNLSFQEEVLAITCCSEKICHILFCLTAFCIIRVFLHTCILSFPHFPFGLFALFFFLFVFLPVFPAFPLLLPLVCRSEIRQYSLQKLHRVK